MNQVTIIRFNETNVALCINIIPRKQVAIQTLFHYHSLSKSNFILICSVTTQQQKRLTTVGGCVGGGYLGSHVGSGSGKTAATIVGTLIGCGGGKILGDKITEDK